MKPYNYIPKGCAIFILCVLLLSITINVDGQFPARPVTPSPSATSSSTANRTPSPPPSPSPPPAPSPPPGPVIPPAYDRGVRVSRDMIPRECRVQVEPGSFVTFHYTAHLVTKENTVGEMFDTTPDDKPMSLRATPRSMLPALARGMIGACIDERRTVVIPSSQAFGSDGFLDVPGDTDIVFLVYVIDVNPFFDMFSHIDTNGDGCINFPEYLAWVESTGRVAANDKESAARRLFRHEDKNKDGLIECEEFLSEYKDCDINISCIHRPDELELLLTDGL